MHFLVDILLFLLLFVHREQLSSPLGFRESDGGRRGDTVSDPVDAYIVDERVKLDGSLAGRWVTGRLAFLFYVRLLTLFDLHPLFLSQREDATLLWRSDRRTDKDWFEGQVLARVLNLCLLELRQISIQERESGELVPCLQRHAREYHDLVALHLLLKLGIAVTRKQGTRTLHV